MSTELPRRHASIAPLRGLIAGPPIDRRSRLPARRPSQLQPGLLQGGTKGLLLLCLMIGLLTGLATGLLQAPVFAQGGAPAASATAVGPAPVTERVTLEKPEDYPSVWSDHGCPNCGIVLVGELTRKLRGKVERIVKVGFVSRQGLATFFRCGVETDVCGTRVEFTADFHNKSKGCEGASSCYAWRFSTDAQKASDTFEVTYVPKP